MPCNSDYLDPDSRELELSRVCCLLDELHGEEWSRSMWDGLHPDIYNKHITKERGDSLVATLCGMLKRVDVTQYSLEMQMWWRDHQAADAAREKLELSQTKPTPMKYSAFTPPSTPVRLVGRLVQETKERFSPGGIALPDTGMKHNIVVEITSPDQYRGERVLIPASTNGQEGWYFPQSDSILAVVEG